MSTHPLLLIDGYKLSHRAQYGSGVSRVYSNFTARGSRVEGQASVVFFGLQYFLQRFLMDDLGAFFDGRHDVPDDTMLDEYTRRVNSYLGPNAIGIEHIRALRDLGYVPLEFRALPEGTSVPLRVPMFTVENTHDDFAWLVNYYETLLSASIWLPSTSATTAQRLRRLLDHAAFATGSPAEFVPWQGHDFSFRGMGGLEAAQLSGAGHLTSFTGSDTVPAIEWIERYYPDATPQLIAGSVPATEHSVMCAGGKATEAETYARLLDLYPSGIVSIVSDTWDLWKVLTETIPGLKDRIMARDGKVVIRPDSGDPVKIICGDESAEPGSPAYCGVIELLWETFGGTRTEKGYKLLDAHIGCIYGDSINYERMEAILAGLANKGFASANMVFGVGSFTYQYVTRDTYNFAMKATYAKVNGEDRALFKAPVTDNGMKFSAVGRLSVHKDGDDRLYAVNNATPDDEARSLLQPVWRDGKFLRKLAFSEVRQNAR